jgi:hypothetical protein
MKLFWALCFFVFHTAAALAGGRPSFDFASDAPEPYPRVSGGQFSAPAVAESPDPLVAYSWPSPKATDGLEIYSLAPMSVQADAPKALANLQSLQGPRPDVTVTGTGSIRMDFGQENAGWLEFDSPDLAGAVEMSISEYDEPAMVSTGPANSTKTSRPQKYGHTYRLELNKELYEGVRFAWIHVRSIDRPWHITGIRLVCQIKPSNYTGSFSCNDPELTRIWYAGAYTVKLNLLRDYFGAILMDRGDRISWTGDAYPAQAAALAAFSNFDFVKANLARTSTDDNGIPSYALYWVLSLVDYFNYTGDAAALDQFLDKACGKLDAAYRDYDRRTNLTFFGWDERLGAGFENPDLPEVRRAYSMLAIRAWREFARAMEQHGRLDLRDKYLRYCDEKIARLRADPQWSDSFGVHAAADAINAGFTNPAEQAKFWSNNFSDRVRRSSYSPFNQYFIIQAMVRAGWTDAALGSVKDYWGGQLRYGGTTFFEIYDPSWNRAIGRNEPVPNAQCGYTSLCHPWGAGVVKWLTEETLGIKPTSPGFATYSICPHLGRTIQVVSGKVRTPHGTIVASFDTEKGKCFFSAPPGTKGDFFIPKVEREIVSIKVNGDLVWNLKHSQTSPGIGAVADDGDFVRLSGVEPGNYDLEITYDGATPAYQEAGWHYPVGPVQQDASTSGNWGGKYGRDGFVLCNYEDLNGKPADRRRLPEYVSAVAYSLNANTIWQVGTKGDLRVLAPSPGNGFPRNASCIYTQDPQACLQTMKVDINLARPHAYQIALYVVDWDRKGRRESIEMFDRATLERIAPVQVVSDFVNGKYLIFRYDKSVRFRIDQIRGDNATLSGIFFDPAP